MTNLGQHRDAQAFYSHLLFPCWGCAGRACSAAPGWHRGRDGENGLPALVEASGRQQASAPTRWQPTAMGTSGRSGPPLAAHKLAELYRWSGAGQRRAGEHCANGRPRSVYKRNEPV